MGEQPPSPGTHVKHRSMALHSCAQPSQFDISTSAMLKQC